MAHSCPDCGCLCHCGGDIDDIDFGEDCIEADLCTHFQTDDCRSSESDDFHDDAEPCAATPKEVQSK